MGLGDLGMRRQARYAVPRVTNSSFTRRNRERETGRQNDCVNGCDVDLSKWRKKAARHKAKPVTKAMEFG